MTIVRRSRFGGNSILHRRSNTTNFMLDLGMAKTLRFNCKQLLQVDMKLKSLLFFFYSLKWLLNIWLNRLVSACCWRNLITFRRPLSRLWIVEQLTVGAIRIIGNWMVQELIEQVHLIPVALQLEVKGFLWSSNTRGRIMIQLTVVVQPKFDQNVTWKTTWPQQLPGSCLGG